MPKKIWIVGLLKIDIDNEECLINLIREKGYKVSTYTFYRNLKNVFKNKRELLLQEIYCFIKILFKLPSFRNNKILCMGGHFSFFFVNKVLSKLMGENFHLYIYNFYLHAMGEKKIIKKLLSYLLNSSRITLIVQSPGEIDYFSNVTNKAKILFVPYSNDVKPYIHQQTEENKLKNYIFTGGYTNRDYPLMFACARRFPDIPFVFIPSSLNSKDLKTDIPANVTLFKDVEKAFFNMIMHDALAIVVPLKHEVGASGQILSLESMAFAKPIIYADVPSINYYFDNGKYGFPYKIGDLESLCSAIKAIIYISKEEREKLGQKAREQYLSKYTRKKRDEALSEIVTEG